MVVPGSVWVALDACFETKIVSIMIERFKRIISDFNAPSRVALLQQETIGEFELAFMLSGLLLKRAFAKTVDCAHGFGDGGGVMISELC